MFAEIEFAFGIDVKTVVGWQTAFVEFAINDADFAVGGCVVEVNAIQERVVLIVALNLGERETRTEIPASAEFPLTLVASRVGQYDVYVVTAVEVRLIGGDFNFVGYDFFVVSVDETEGVDSPQIPVFVFIFQGKVETVGFSFFNQEVKCNEEVGRKGEAERTGR